MKYSLKTVNRIVKNTHAVNSKITILNLIYYLLYTFTYKELKRKNVNSIIKEIMKIGENSQLNIKNVSDTNSKIFIIKILNVLKFSENKQNV